MTPPPATELPDPLAERLRLDLGYGPDAYADAVPRLAEFLRAAAERSDAAGDDAAFAEASQKLADFLQHHATPALACWFVFALERADLVRHGFDLLDVWVTDKGRNLLAELAAARAGTA